MANPGVGTKFVSVNLNKSYGQPSHHHHSSFYGSNQTRAGVHGSSGGGGGMVVLSRPRSSQKTVQKLSVPPPLNLPSLRKEHERFDSMGSSGGLVGGGVSGSGSRSTSSSMGWSRSGAVALQKKEGHVDRGADGNDQSLQGLDGVTKGGILYTPPSACPGSSAHSSFAFVEKKPVLRGEDFPSLQATLPSGLAQKQKDGRKHKSVDESSYEHRDISHRSSNVNMRPQLHVSCHSTSNGLNGNVTESHGGNSYCRIEPAQGQKDYFPGPLPLSLVRMNPRSDWADDERDTSHSLMDRGRDHGFSKGEAYWDRDCDMPRISVPPKKPMRNFSERWGHCDSEVGKVCSSEVGKVCSSEVSKVDTRDIRTPSREGPEGNTWKNSSLSQDGFGVQEVGKDVNGFGPRPSTLSRELRKKNNKYTSFLCRENAHDDFRRRETGNMERVAQPWHNYMGSFGGQGVERNTRDHFSGEQYSRHSGDALGNSTVAKFPYSFNGKGLLVNDPILNLGRDKGSFSKGEKPYIEEAFMKDFETNGYDGRDPFSGGPVGVVKKKKDALKQTDFHDPVRESFEAELERVQKMQEQERKQIIEEQERSLEQARREEEERSRLVREQEERQRRLEEAAREAAWRAEYERLETMRRAEEQKIAREEEKHRILMEEERRKHAAKQKLLELDERIAKRQAEVAKAGSSYSAGSDEKMSLAVKEKEIGRAAYMGDWEDGERMVERITTSSSDSSNFNRPLEMGARPHFSRENSAGCLERGKSVNSWRKDAFENGNSSILHMNDQDNGHHHSPRQDALVGSVFDRKEFYGGTGYISSRTYKAGIAEPHADDYNHRKGQRWNLSGDGDHYSKNMGIDHAFHDHLAENFGDVGWGIGLSHGNPYSLYPERLYPNSEVDGPYSFGRSRYYPRQPCVLPPPIASMHKTAYRGEIEPSGPSPFENEMQYIHHSRNEPAIQTSYANNHTENLRQPEINDVQKGNTENVEQKVDSNARPRCDSQSSLSVSSPPNSPTHLSHDDLDESRESSMLLAEGGSKDVSQLTQENGHVLPGNAAKENMVSASSSISLGDDEEWTIERNDLLQEQEEYDEDEDGFQEEDEVHEGDEENIDLTQEFDDMHLGDKISPCMMDNLVLGFNEGVEVGMPNDDFEKGLKNGDGMFTMPQVSSCTLEERRSFDGISGDGQNSQPLDGSSRKFQETEKAVVDLVGQQSNSGQDTSVSKLLDKVDVSSSSGFASQHSVSSYVNQVPLSSSGQPVISAIGAVPNQAEVPLKLQFGLFSGPSLIPSPVPTIQIGSIQMPLHLHPYVAPLTHMHTSQPPPLFQFGQLRYTSPVSQGVPLAPQSMSFLQPNASSSSSFTQDPGGTLPIQPGQESSRNLPKSEFMSLPLDNETSILSRHLDVCQGSVTREINSLPARGNDDTSGMNQLCQPDISCIGDRRSRSESGIHAENQVYLNSGLRNYAALSRKSESQSKSGTKLSQPVIKEKGSRGPKMSGAISGSKGKRSVFMVKNSGSKSSYPAPDFVRAESGGYHRKPERNVQRTEFRVRHSADKRHPSSVVSSEHMGMDEKTNIMGSGAGFPARSGPGKLNRLNMSSKQMTESECLNSDPLSSREMDSGSRAENGAVEEALTKSQNILHSGDANLKRNISFGDDVDAPLHSGIVRVFEQPGIEAPTDEDDFIEVRSKRQTLNDRRDQREKEIKAKSQASKAPRKLHCSSKDKLATPIAGRFSVSTGSETVDSIQPDFVATEGHGLINMESSNEFSTLVVFEPLAPIGTPAVKSENNSDIRSQSVRSVKISSMPEFSVALKVLGQGLMFDNNNNVLDSVPTSLGSWGNSKINQQVMTLTRNQLDEVMKSGKFDSKVNNRSISNSSMASSSILTKDKVFSSSASAISSLLAGEKIQFGAVTSPTILPPGIAASHEIGLLGSCRSVVQQPHHLSGPESDCDLLFEKDKCTSKSCVHLEDCEAAASAVAVAAISSEESGGNGLGTSSVSVSDTNMGGADIDGITGEAGDQQFSSQSMSEESLSVSLPADLSVETPAISLWPPLPSSQNSSGQMHSHFPGGRPSHFPFYEMNPMLGDPVFAFGPHEESSSNSHHQTLSQKSSKSASTPVGTWQQCHSGVESFYGPAAGFTGPFISPSSGIPGVQGPPHMVVYNHFAPAPIGQFGQVGLSFMGTTYIPSEKPPDWKHTPASSAIDVGEGEMNNLNMISTQRSPMQHMVPGSPLIPMASPLAMSDVSPLQSSADMTVKAQWPHLPVSPLSSVPMSMPLQQADGVLASKFGHGSVDQSLTVNRFPNSQGKNWNYPLVTDATITQLPDELGLVDPSSSSSIRVSVRSTSSDSMIVNFGKMDARQSDSSRNSKSNSKNQSSHPKNYNQSSGYNYWRTGGASRKNSSGGEWDHHRRTRSHGRSQSSGAEKSYHSLKMKQIYVVKHTSTGTSTTL